MGQWTSCVIISNENLLPCQLNLGALLRFLSRKNLGRRHSFLAGKPIGLAWSSSRRIVSMALRQSSVTKRDVFVAWLGGALVGTVIGFNAGVITGLNVLVPSRDRKDRQPIVYLLGASSGVIAFALWGVWTVSQLLRESFLSNAGFQIIRRNVTNRLSFFFERVSSDL